MFNLVVFIVLITGEYESATQPFPDKESCLSAEAEIEKILDARLDVQEYAALCLPRTA